MRIGKREQTKIKVLESNLESDLDDYWFDDQVSQSEFV